MKRSLLFFAAWVAATAAVGSVAMLVVGAAGERVSEEAVIPLSAREIEALQSATAGDSGVPGNPAAGTTEAGPASTTAGIGTSVPPDTVPRPTTTAATTTTAGGVATTTTASSSTTSATTTSTTTAVADRWHTTAHTLPGGTVVIRFDGTRVELVSAAPNPGYVVEIGSRGPGKVSVEFEGKDTSFRFKAEVEGGDLVIEQEDDD